jgi:hypothetical protein
MTGPLRIHATLTPPGYSPWRVRSQLVTPPDAVTDGGGWPICTAHVAAVMAA